jgi:hypothetical protein
VNVCPKCSNDRVVRCWDWDCFVCANDEYCDAAEACVTCASFEDKAKHADDNARLRAAGQPEWPSLEKWLTASRELARRELMAMVQRWRIT